MRLMLIVGLLTLFAQKGKAKKNNTTQWLLDSLRRQLMQDNYDYMRSGESEQITTQPPEELPIIRARDLDMSGNEDYPKHQESLHEEESNDSSQADGALQTLDEDQTTPTLENHFQPLIEMSHKALHYSNLYNEHFRENEKNEPYNAGHAGETTVQYEVFEVPAVRGRSGRRSGNAPRRFLQEERPDQVAIVPLDEGPIPEFRLPPSRRQFMGSYDWPQPMYGERLPPEPPLRGNWGLPSTRTVPSPATTKRRFRAPNPRDDPSAASESESYEHQQQQKTDQVREALEKVIKKYNWHYDNKYF